MNAVEFIETPLVVGNVSGPVFGNTIERHFRRYLEDQGYEVPADKADGDFSELKVDLKTIQFRGRRGGAAKFHGYSKTGPPVYSLLVIGYVYASGRIEFEDVFFIPAEQVTWVQAQHYLCSMTDDRLKQFRVPR